MSEHPLLVDAVEGDKALQMMRQGLTANPAIWYGLFGWLFVHALGEALGTSYGVERSRSWLDEWLLGKVLLNTFRELGLDKQTSTQTLTAIKLATGQQELLEGHVDESPDVILSTLLRDSDAQQLLGINRYGDILWYTKEGFDQLLVWLLIMATILS